MRTHVIAALLAAAIFPLTALAQDTEATPGPDERMLWNMYHKQKWQLLNQAVTSWQQEFPGWQPPAEIAEALHPKETARTTSNKATPPVKTPPKLTRCQTMLQSREALSVDEAKRLDMFEQSIVDCENEAQRLALLDLAAPALFPDDFDVLLKAAPKQTNELRLREYQQHRRWLVTWFEQRDPRASALLRHMLTAITQQRDAELIALIGWQRYNDNDYPAAASWFNKARQWQPSDKELIYASTLANFKAGELDTAARIAQQHSDDAKLQQLLGEIRIAQGWQAFNEQDYAASLRHAEQARTLVEQPREAELLMAWSYFHLNRLAQSLPLAEATLPESQALLTQIHTRLAWQALEQKQFADARDRFAQLYQNNPDEQLAEGLVTSQYALDQNEKNLRALAQRYGGDVARITQRLLDEQRVNQLYGRKEFLAANAIKPSPVLGGIDSHALEGGLQWRDKSGKPGTSKLQISEAPVISGYVVRNRVDTLQLSVASTTLTSGKPSFSATSAAIGSAGYYANPTPDTEEQQFENGMAWQLDYRRSGWLSPHLALGATPDNGVISPSLTYEAGMKQQYDRGYWQAALYARPVRDSLLSYTGLKDPYSDLTWGQVIRQGVEGEALYRINNHWTSTVGLTYANLGGEHVADNTSYGFNSALSRDLHRDGFDYFTLGPEIGYQTYDRNLSHFTLGHGGYFSPQNLWRIGVAMNLLSSEGKRRLVKSRLAVAYQRYEEAAEDWFPTDGEGVLPDNALTQRYTGTNHSGLAYDAQIKALYLLTPTWQASAGFSLRNSSGYRDVAAALEIRYYLDQRQALFSSDMPAGMLDTLY